ncbi:unnamed protein product [Diplocarpon coronariae]
MCQPAHYLGPYPVFLYTTTTLCIHTHTAHLQIPTLDFSLGAADNFLLPTQPVTHLPTYSVTHLPTQPLRQGQKSRTTATREDSSTKDPAALSTWDSY